MNELQELLNHLESNIPQQTIINPAVSASPVGWHIEHILLTINLIIEALKISNSANYKRRFSIMRILVFTLNKIPRGKARAPRVVQPKVDFNLETLKQHLELVKNKLDELSSIDPNQYFEHPYFGHLKLKPTIKFLGIHTRHHLHIINDIIGK